MIYEMRADRCMPGRLPALLKRFETIMLDIWKKHGIRPADFWTTLIGESNHDLIYMIQWDSLAAREKKWGAFMSPGMDCQARGSRAGGSDCLVDLQPDSSADRVFVGEVR